MINHAGIPGPASVHGDQSMTTAACTIVSLNYMPYARVLCQSFLALHPEAKFYVLLVDRLPEGFDTSQEEFELVLIEDLGISDLLSVAFKFGILELNTNVKPTFLRRLLESGIDKLIYFDPDILICSSVNPIYEALDTNPILLTPHCTSPNEDEPYSEILLLINGVFNLGFIALSKSSEALDLLSWWEKRCLTLGYSERWTGLFVDQKWMNLAVCYFDSAGQLKHPGCNVAYWNLHERVLERHEGAWLVNRTAPLIFFHFSGVDVDGGNRISKHCDHFNLVTRPDLSELFAYYRQLLVDNGIREMTRHRYAFGHFYDGTPITKLQRAAFAANLDTFCSSDPFDPNGPFFKWARRRHLQHGNDTVGKYGRGIYNASDTRVRLVTVLFRLALRLLGADRYTILMKYLEFASVLRNQRDILGPAGPNPDSPLGRP
jgi:hypothetical protein